MTAPAVRFPPPSSIPGLDGSREATPVFPPEGDVAVSPESELSFDDTDAGDYSGVHKILSDVDKWFHAEVGQIEREAQQFAGEWAAQNMPGLTERREEILPPETVLGSRCESLWKQWPQRMKVKVQEAIDRAGDELSRAVSEGRAAVTEAKVAGDELEDAEKKIEDIRRATERENPKVAYGAFMKMRLWLPLSLLLVSVEFVANQPVFRIIWPLSRLIEQSARDAVESSSTAGMLAGIRLTITEVLMHVEASVLAVAVVIMLFVLAKELGVAVRALTALKPEDHPFSSASIRALHRQKKVVAGVTALSTVFIVFFLWSARYRATDVVQSRLDNSITVAKAAQAGLDSVVAAGAERADEVQTRSQSLVEAQEDVASKRDLLGFARTVKDNNVAILILNLALVGVAFVIGFLSDARDMTETRGEHPDLPHLKQKCLGCRERLRRFTDQARDAVRRGDTAISKVNSLLRSKPLATMQAKRSRLLAMIPRWRGENARLRGLDPSHILAFQQPIALDLSEFEESVELKAPETLDSFRQELERLRSAANRVERIADGLDAQAA